MTTSIVDRLLAGATEAKKEYRDTLTIDLQLDPAFAERWVSNENVAQLNEAKRMGIHPDSIFAVCCTCASGNWTMRTVGEAKDYAREFRKIAKELRRLLKKTLVPVSEVPERDRTSSSLRMLPKGSPRFSGYDGFTLLAPKSFHAVRGIADEREGLLEKCAQDLELVIPALTKANPHHRLQHIGKSKFQSEWANLVRNTSKPRLSKGRYSELGAWFFEVTFGTKQYQAASLAKRNKRASPSRTS